MLVVRVSLCKDSREFKRLFRIFSSLFQGDSDTPSLPLLDQRKRGMIGVSRLVSGAEARKMELRK